MASCQRGLTTTLGSPSGLNAKAVSTLAGHASIDVTFDRYRHLFPGSEDEAGAKLNALHGPSTGDNVVALPKRQRAA